MVGYAVETQGIRFQVNPDLLTQTVETILDGEDLRLHLRCNFAVYHMAPYATEADIFIKSLLEAAEVVVDYWLHEVVPASKDEPRLLDRREDYDPLLDYYATHRIVRQAEVEEFATYLTDDFFQRVNETLEIAFKETPQFHDFVDSVVLHSLSSLLKNLIARLGGVGSDDLVAYADLPVLDQVDRSIDPRILVMDTVEGGSGGIAQAFDRLDLTDNEGSLWWTLQTQLGHCPIGDGEALVKAVLTRAAPEQIQNVQQAQTPETIESLLNDLDLSDPKPAASRALGRALFGETEVSGQNVNPALILQELFALQETLDAQVPGTVPREITVRRAVVEFDPDKHPHIAGLRDALHASGADPNELGHELGLQLLAIYESACDDGCPVCLSADSDVEHYYLTPLLNSRRALRKLRQVLLSSVPTGDCLAALSDTLLVIFRDFIADGRWEERWGGNEHKPYETPGGVRVRSRAEYIIATKLEAAGIPFEYEPRLPYTDDEGRTRFIHPDFHLYEHELYVEYWGRDDPEYVESRRFKERVYERLADQRGVRVLHLEARDVENDVFMGKIEAALSPDD